MSPTFPSPVYSSRILRPCCCPRLPLAIPSTGWWPTLGPANPTVWPPSTPAGFCLRLPWRSGCSFRCCLFAKPANCPAKRWNLITVWSTATAPWRYTPATSLRDTGC
ncbi:hypothetical protein GBAR_LOCUS30974 [Geodia barretti]|uniref:Uncharacterized protein n=1 Tax=Geodia barretti TaxID=519541 RepID=A0AA35U0A1_GEOBA|nr:hypothetical protein GBAR_LOCUS30974 [Geodia barretti]